MVRNVISGICGIFLMLLKTICLADENLMIYLEESTIKGLKASDGDYFMYLGIPYATVDEYNHFGSAIPYTIPDIFEAYDDTAMCPQVNHESNTIVGTIDCLRLNVYVPTSVDSSNTLLPVMVWIYGGLFHHGLAGRHTYGPNYLVEHDVIIVAINYRTGPYGFMCLDIPEISGNQGLKDQYLAIQWVKNNIEAFGGDPRQITLFGQGAGGQSIDLHLMSSREIFFKNIILQSASAQSITSLYYPDKLAPLKMARYVGLETNDIKAAISHLSNIETNLVINAALKLNLQFKPCVESLFDNIEPFIESTWINAEVPKVKNMTVLMGFTNHEMAKLVKDAEHFNNSSIINYSLAQVLDIEHKFTEMCDIVSHYYFGDEGINSNIKWNVIRFGSDFTIIHPIHRTLRKYLENNARRIYFYMFSYVGERNEVITTDYDEFDSHTNLCCASHSDDLHYLFLKQSKPTFTDADRLTTKRMTSMWTNFAKYDNPTPAVTEVLPVIWEPLTKSTYYYLNIDKQLKLGKRPLHKRMAFWDILLSQKGLEEELK